MAFSILRVLPASLTSAYVAPEPGSGLHLTREEADGVLELAHLTTAVDEAFTSEEIAAFDALVATLLGPKASGQAVVRELERRRQEDGAEGRLAVVVKKLGRVEARELAYTISFALSMVDLATGDEESDFDAGVVKALGIGEERAQELASDVFNAVADDAPAG